MPLTPDEIGESVLRDKRGRGKIFQLRRVIWIWLQSTNWFITEYPEQHDQVKLVDEVERSIRAKWALKAQKTRAENIVREEKEQKIRRDKARQLSFKL